MNCEGVFELWVYFVRELSGVGRMLRVCFGYVQGMFSLTSCTLTNC
jgi:hypothetical protein